ncbi:myb-related transcription factor, partner of profilin-like [Pseudophryne corroboree]|uniref:myb-related transcription factor, partner of profilin-like n=1 Tax=Pseudophryne corroboree TaxID=495146 RepID=UPI003081BAEC
MEKSKKKTKPRKARSQPEEQSEEEASGEDAGPKKPRGPRYTEAENCALVDGIDRSYDILYGPRAQTTAAKTKQNIWDAIARQVTAVSGNRRSIRNCMKRYSDCRRQTKKKMGIQRRHETATGGGPALNLKWLPWVEVIKRRMNPAMVQGVRGGVDSSRLLAFPRKKNRPEDGRQRETSSPKGGLMTRLPRGHHLRAGDRQQRADHHLCSNHHLHATHRQRAESHLRARHRQHADHHLRARHQRTEHHVGDHTTSWAPNYISCA